MLGESHGSWCWNACADELRHEAHQAATFDLSGQRQHPTPSDPVNPKNDAEAIRDQREQCGPEPPVLVGHSLAESASRKPWQRPVHTDPGVGGALVLQPGERAIDRIPESRRPSYFELAEASAIRRSP